MAKGEELLRGVAGSKGEIVATVRIVDGDKTKMVDILPGEVMVGDRTTPAHINFMKKAAAFIMNKGGSTSHTGIVAREMGKPAVLGTVNATTTLYDGQKVIVDGNEGVVWEYVPEKGEVSAPKPAPKPVSGPLLSDKLADTAAKRGFSLPPGFLEKMRKRE